MSKLGPEASVDPALLPIVIPQDDSPTSLVPHSLFGLEVFPTQASIFAFLTETLESSAWRDGLKLLIIGGTMEAARRGCYSLFTKIYDSEFQKGYMDLSVYITASQKSCIVR